MFKLLNFIKFNHFFDKSIDNYYNIMYNNFINL